MQIKPATSEIRTKPVVRDPPADGGAYARSTRSDIDRAEAEGMGPPEVQTPGAPAHPRMHELSGRSMTFDLTAEANNLSVATDAAQAARTLAKLDDLRLVLMKLGEGKTIERHQASHQMSLQTIAGHVTLHIDGVPLDVPSGNVVVLEANVSHDIVAKVDSTILLTVAGASS